MRELVEPRLRGQVGCIPGIPFRWCKRSEQKSNSLPFPILPPPSLSSPTPQNSLQVGALPVFFCLHSLVQAGWGWTSSESLQRNQLCLLPSSQLSSVATEHLELKPHYSHRGKWEIKRLLWLHVRRGVLDTVNSFPLSEPHSDCENGY